MQSERVRVYKYQRGSLHFAFYNDDVLFPLLLLLLRMDRYDVFPTRVFEDITEFQKIVGQKSFDAQKLQSFAFITVRDTSSNEIKYTKVDLNEKLITSLNRCLKDTVYRNEMTGTLNVQWSYIQQKLNRPLRMDDIHEKQQQRRRRINADMRMGFRWENMFLVKSYFTFGQRKTEIGQVHIIRTTQVPILYNVPKTEFKQEIHKKFQESSFQCMDQFKYQCFVLQPESVYIVPSDVVYILLAVQKTLFALDVVKAPLISELRTEWGYRFKNPESQKCLELPPAQMKKFWNKRQSTTDDDSKSQKILKLDDCITWIPIDIIQSPKVKRGRKKKPSPAAATTIEDEKKEDTGTIYFVPSSQQQQQQPPETSDVYFRIVPETSEKSPTTNSDNGNNPTTNSCSSSSNIHPLTNQNVLYFLNSMEMECKEMYETIDFNHMLTTTTTTTTM